MLAKFSISCGNLDKKSLFVQFFLAKLCSSARYTCRHACLLTFALLPPTNVAAQQSARQ